MAALLPLSLSPLPVWACPRFHLPHLELFYDPNQADYLPVVPPFKALTRAC